MINLSTDCLNDLLMFLLSFRAKCQCRKHGSDAGRHVLPCSGLISLISSTSACTNAVCTKSLFGHFADDCHKKTPIVTESSPMAASRKEAAGRPPGTERQS
eukprot:gnl/TRDRNA2_/TRDRNA2_142548_c0_seq1.p1 gnl/TRDRNA2_/TRDRNA2_142548_c0~~gnl/TRDRNA2_/TRDRNA2_142548_c0_seq1.p1  ORF type:complete len:101 (-),score=8.52 gnl/TRDRNA2_/TRDRNA2_142548_c0_seq1:176-478(-)